LLAADSASFGPLLNKVHNLFLDRKLSLATAESCTGGLLGAVLTHMPGSSAYYSGGVIAYANEAKTRLLGISAALIDQHGAVSSHVAREMAEKIKAMLTADIAIAITGIAGPGGGTLQKPVGTVWTAIAHAGGTEIELLQLQGDRSFVRAQAAHAVLERLVALVLAAKSP